jgi:hypothetical protein
MAEIDYKKQAEEIAKANAKLAGKGGGPAPTSSGNKAIDKALGETAEKLNPFGQSLKDAGGAAATGLKAVQGAVQDGLNTWRDLSKSGAGFNNDIVGMTVAAAGTRLPLKDFAGVIKDNTDILGQLGGSVTRGAESFAKMSKQFFDSGATDSLKQLGYTNKDLNEVLALQAVTLRGSFRDEQERNDVAIKQASELATEMDLMAKLTGKSREAQMEQMKKNQMDMQFEASIRLKTQGMNATEAAAFEANARMQLKDAQLRGAGDMFKEIFATGQIQSKEAATQAAVNQEQYEATRKQALATSIGDEKAASAANREAQRAAQADANNTTKLGLVSLGAAGGAAGKALTDSMGAQITATKALEGYAAANKMSMETVEDREKVQKAMEADAKKAAAGQDKDGKQVDGATKAAVQLGNRLDDTRAALTKGLLEPLNDQIGPGLRTFAEKYLSGKDFEGSGKRMAPAIEGAMARGTQAAQGAGAPNYKDQPDEAGPVTQTAKGLGFGAGKVLKVGKEGLDAVNNIGKPIEKKAKGGPVEEGEPYIVGDGGEEEIFVPKTAGEIIPKSMLAPKSLASRSQNMEGAFKSMQSMDPAKMFADLKVQTAGGGLNLNEISKDISTTVSGGGSSTIKVPDMSDMTKKFETSFSKLTSDIKLPDMKELSTPFGNAFKDFNLSFSSITKAGAEKVAKTPIPTEPFDEFGSNFDEVVAKMAADVSDAMPLEAMDKNAAAIEYASKRRQELEDIMNDGQARSGTEWDEIFDEAEQLDEQIAKYTEKQVASMQDYSDGWYDIGELNDKVSDDIKNAIPVDEFGDLDGAIAKNKEDDDIRAAKAAWDSAVPDRLSKEDTSGAMKAVVAGSSPTATQSRGITMDSFTIGPNGMPIAKPKSTSAAAPEKPAEKKASPGKAINPETGEEYTPLSELEKQQGQTSSKSKPAAGGDTKAATLDDVVKSLNALNTKMGQLISTTESGNRDVAKAAKSGSNNLYAR